MGAVTDVLDAMTGQRVYFDANVFVNFLDQHPDYFELVEPLLRAAYDGRIIAVTGDAVVAEVMVKPYQLANPIQIREIQSFFATRHLLEIRSHSTDDFDAAARLRAGARMKFIDALHYATAVNARCQYLVTNDGGFATSSEITVVPIQSLRR